MKVIANISYLDKELNRQVAEGEVLEVTEERGKVLTTNQFNNVFYCSLVEEAKEEKPPVKRKRKQWMTSLKFTKRKNGVMLEKSN